ncbi:hypothetical protein H8F24_12460 [Synechococcus sp. CBW1002]|uniref:hypothetical protein n=1 Tax=Synechococcus sp. CBW1002 TaxID=1353134 RepID=UPI0018CECF81|nr:hypothetical protein [Synechococcus sp. CBW1002]QPN58931.1 hypothetical protein H8F24_12460 [Synechococcus sp. CBW1002]
MARSPSNPQLVLRPQDLVVLLRLALDPGPAPTDAALGAELGLTASETHAAVVRTSDPAQRCPPITARLLPATAMCRWAPSDEWVPQRHHLHGFGPSTSPWNITKAST